MIENRGSKSQLKQNLMYP